MSQTLESPYVDYVRRGLSVEEVMRLQGVDRRAAIKRLGEAREVYHSCIDSAVNLLRHSGGTREMPIDTRGKSLSRKHSWTSLALGTRKAA